MDKQIDLFLITGFLGAGKTTVLKEILNSNQDSKIGIIMNEFGKVGIDGGIVDDRSASLIEINRGSIFCDCLKLSFVESLSEMSKNPIDKLFVEGSGLADPSNIGEILEAAEVLVGKKYNYKGSICLVDALHFIDQSKDIESVNRQVKYSNLAVVSKSDLVDSNTLDFINNLIFEFNKDIKVVRSEMGKLPIDVFNEDLLHGKSIHTDETTNKKENKPKTLTLDIFEEVETEKLVNFLNEISNETYRMKGYVNLKDKGIHQVDVVNSKIDFKNANSDKDSQIVIISKVGPSIIRNIISSWENIVNVKYKLKN